MDYQEEAIPTAPRGQVIESQYFLAKLKLEGDPYELAEQLAVVMRMQNGLSVGARKVLVAPAEWKELEGGAEAAIAGKASYDLEETWSPTGRRFGEGRQRGITTGAVAEHLETVFGTHVSVRPLYQDMGHLDDVRLMDAVKERFGERHWLEFRNYPTLDDVLSAGQQENALIGTQGSYAKKSSYFTASLTTKSPSDEGVFNAAAFSAACKNLLRAAGLLVIPLGLRQRKDGRWELRIAGRVQSSMGRSAAASDADADPIAYYFDCSVKIRTYGTTVADAEDMLEADRVADEIEGLGLPEPEDFAAVICNEVDEEAWVSGNACIGAALMPSTNGDEPSAEEELEQLIGLDDVKRQILEFVNFAAAQKERGGTMPSLHLWMTGNPGTGKTTVARIIGHLFYERGLIPKRNVFVEADRGALVAGYVGQTASKTKATIAKARRGILFIDEAYALAQGDHDSFGEEALAALVKAMEDCRQNFARDGFACIMAGYPEPMERMVSVNPGLRDRFGFRLEFPDYSAEELMKVFELYAANERYSVTMAARDELARALERAVNSKGGDFANARLVRKIFERCEMRQARLFGPDSSIKKDTVLSVLSDRDIASLFEGSPHNKIGFVV